jgi:hypothetical protein
MRQEYQGATACPGARPRPEAEHAWRIYTGLARPPCPRPRKHGHDVRSKHAKLGLQSEGKKAPVGLCAEHEGSDRLEALRGAERVLGQRVQVAEVLLEGLLVAEGRGSGRGMY